MKHALSTAPPSLYSKLNIVESNLTNNSDTVRDPPFVLVFSRHPLNFADAASRTRRKASVICVPIDAILISGNVTIAF